jgi:hypothetical protein
MTRYLPVAAAVVVIVVAAIVQGIWTERWGTFPELELYANQLKNVPKEIGDWTGEDLPPEDKRIMEIAGAVGSLSRIYRNDRNEQVSMFIVCGRLDDVFFHSPDRCYPAAGFETSSEVVNQSIEAGTDVAEFKTATFLKADPGGNQNLRIYWSFNGSGPWVAPDAYRWAFAGQRALYKIYVVTPSTGREISADQNPAVDFIRAAIPELNRAFAPALKEGRKASTVTDTTKPVEGQPTEAKSE